MSRSLLERSHRRSLQTGQPELDIVHVTPPPHGHGLVGHSDGYTAPQRRHVDGVVPVGLVPHVRPVVPVQNPASNIPGPLKSISQSESR